VAGSTGGEGVLARDALMNTLMILLETGKPDALKDACPVWEGAVGKGLALASTSLAAYFIITFVTIFPSFSLECILTSEKHFSLFSPLRLWLLLFPSRVPL
jgi:hypothetical protein